MDFVTFTKVFWKIFKLKGNSNYEGLGISPEGAEAELVILTDAKNKTELMTATIDTAIDALQNILNQWHTIGAKYDSLLKNVDKINPDRLALLKIDLKIAKDSWQEI